MVGNCGVELRQRDVEWILVPLALAIDSQGRPLQRPPGLWFCRMDWRLHCNSSSFLLLHNRLKRNFTLERSTNACPLTVLSEGVYAFTRIFTSTENRFNKTRERERGADRD